jgi:hypothetical protein
MSEPTTPLNPETAEPLDAVLPSESPTETPGLLPIEEAIGAARSLVGLWLMKARPDAIDEAIGELATRLRSVRLSPPPTETPGLRATTLTVPDSIKMLRETLSVAQNRIGNSPLDAGRRREHMDRLQRLIDDCERQRPTGPDGKHGDRHTPTCGCIQAPTAGEPE